jgi:hypothetical protein
MPYIKTEDRPFYDAIANTIATKLMLEQFNFVAEYATFERHVLSREENKQDGDLNFFITKFMKVLGLTDRYKTHFYYGKYASIVETAIFDFVVGVYTKPSESYYRFNRAIGMLTACRNEMVRRYGKDKAKYAIEILDKVLQRLYDDVVAPYEDKKILENGDV